MGVSTGVIQAMEAESNSGLAPSNQSPSEFSECRYCRAQVRASATRCDSCYYDLEPLVQTAPREQERVVFLEESDYKFLDCDPQLLEQLDKDELVRIHNLLVEALRRGCQMLVRADPNPVLVRQGLVVSKEWDAHYRNLWPLQPKFLIWMAVRHAVLGNPLAGEVFEWNNQGTPAAKSNTGGKVAGAAALGILAGFLFS